jgi:hypothetical protein
MKCCGQYRAVAKLTVEDGELGLESMLRRLSRGSLNEGSPGHLVAEIALAPNPSGINRGGRTSDIQNRGTSFFLDSENFDRR